MLSESERKAVTAVMAKHMDRINMYAPIQGICGPGTHFVVAPDTPNQIQVVLSDNVKERLERLDKIERMTTIWEQSVTKGFVYILSMIHEGIDRNNGETNERYYKDKV